MNQSTHTGLRTACDPLGIHGEFCVFCLLPNHPKCTNYLGVLTSSHHALTTIHKPIVADIEHPGEYTTMTVDTPAPSTLYLWYLILIATVGPLQFGYHLASFSTSQRYIKPANKMTAVRIKCSQQSHPM